MGATRGRKGYGLVVLAARTANTPYLSVEGGVAAEIVRLVEPDKRHFTVPLASGDLAPLKPFAEIQDEAYGVYFKTPG